MTDQTATTPTFADAWKRDSQSILFAALGRAENTLNTDPDIAAIFRGLDELEVAMIRAGMLAAASHMRDVLRESGYLFADGAPVPDGVPDAVADHAQQTMAAHRKAGLL